MPVPRTPLVGRQPELDKLSRALEAAAAGNPTFVLLRGEAGIGKTALLRAASWLAEARELRVLSGTGIATGAAVPYLPLMAPLGAAVPGLAHTSRPARAVRRLLDGETGDDHHPDSAQVAHLVEAIYEVVTDQPTLLVVDDVHWADGATLMVLDYLSHRAEGARLAVIAAARDDELGGIDHLPIADGRRYLQLRLDRLERSSVAQQVAMLTGSSVSEKDIQPLYERSAGIPLFVEELVAEEATRGTPPASLRALLAGRIARLSTEARLVADALAVVAHPSAADLIAAVTDLAPDVAARALTAAEVGGVAVHRAGRHALRHPLFGEALVADLEGTPRAVALHRRTAAALAATGAPPAETVRHHEAAGDRKKTWAASLAAGRQAEAASAFGEARTHYQRAAEMWPDDTAGRGPTLQLAARSAWIVGDAGDAVALAREGIAAGVEGPGPVVELAQYLWDAGHRQESREAFARVGDSLGKDAPATTRGRYLWGLGRAQIGNGRYADARRMALEAAKVAEGAGDQLLLSDGLLLAGLARLWDGHITGIDDLEAGLAAARRSGDPVTIGRAYVFTAGNVAVAGRLDDARSLGFEGVAICDRLGLARSHGSDVRGVLGGVLIELGQWREAEEVLEAADARAGATFSRALLALRRGEWEAWEREAAAAETELSVAGSDTLSGSRELAHAELAWLTDRPQEGLDQLAAIESLPGVWAADIGARQALWRARLGDPQEAAAHPPDPALDAAIRAELAARGSGSGAAWEACMLAWERARLPYERTVALISAAEDAYRRGERAAGRSWLDAAARAAADLGARPLVGRAERLARRARVTIRVEDQPTSPVERSSLTAREGEVLALLAEGRTNPQIAQELFISPKTAGIHVQRVIEKLDAHTRGEAVANARRRGLLE